MNIRIIGDGVAGVLTSIALTERGHDVFLVGDRHRPPVGVTAMVHPFAGRSLAMSSEEELAWSTAAPVLQGFVDEGWGVRTVMRRPLDGAAGRRIQRSFERDEVRYRRDWGVDIDADFALGPCLRYEPAFGIDMGTALQGLRGRCSYEARPYDLTILAVGPRLLEWLTGDDLRAFGGELAVFDRRVEGAMSGRGVHVMPTIDGHACAGSTWWTSEERLSREDAASDLTRRFEGLHGVRPDVLDIWSGWRCVYQPDRRPVVGRLDDATYVAGALGTRGWLWAPVVAKQLSAALDGEAIHPAFDVARTSLRLA